MNRRPLTEKLRKATKDTPLCDLSGPNCNQPHQRSRQLAYRARRDGLLTPEPCSECGLESPVVMHHRNYYRPLDVTWFCAPCHQVEHGRLYRSKIIIPGSSADLRLKGLLRDDSGLGKRHAA